MDMCYAIMIEKVGSKFSGDVSDWRGCIAAGATVELNWFCVRLSNFILPDFVKTALPFHSRDEICFRKWSET
jgi:hypothetical protein